jgi:hypothetical protein
MNPRHQFLAHRRCLSLMFRTDPAPPINLWMKSQSKRDPTSLALALQPSRKPVEDDERNLLGSAARIPRVEGILPQNII